MYSTPNPIRFHSLLESEKTRLREEVNRVVTYCDNLSTKQLQSHFPHIVDDIFGLNGKPGFNLKEITYNENCYEFELLFKLLNPHTGPVFTIIYRLISDGSSVFEFPIRDLPPAVQQEIGFGTCYQFYYDKVKLNFDTMSRDVLVLNAFEYYIFYFMAHLVKPSKSAGSFSYGKYPKHLSESVSVRLCKEYISAFLPYEGLMPIQNCTFPIRSHIPKSRPLKKPVFLKKEILSQLVEPPIDTVRPEEPLTDIWRSYIFSVIAIDFLTGVPIFSETQLEEFSLPPVENIYLIQYLLQHLHMFTYFSKIYSESKEEFKRLVVPLFQKRMYNFLKLMIVRWPNDGSYHIIVEPWLIYIQPWCFFTPTVVDVTRLQPELIDNRWHGFISNNFLFYSYLFQLIIQRFKNLSFSSINNMILLEKVLCVYATTNLGKVVEGIEEALINISTESKSKVVESVRTHIICVEGVNFNFSALFSVDFQYEISSLVNLISNHIGSLTNVTVAQNEKPPSGLFSWLCLGPGSPRSDPFDLDSIKHLSNIRELLMSLFQIPATESRESQDETSEDLNLSRTPRARKIRLVRQARYTGDPDLKPIQSFEISFLVRVFYSFSKRLNAQYGERIQALYNTQNFKGKFFRLILQGPTTVSAGPRQTIDLPPRLSLRPLAHRLIYIYFAIFVVFLYLFRIPALHGFFYVVLPLSLYLLVRTFFHE